MTSIVVDLYQQLHGTYRHISSNGAGLDIVGPDSKRSSTKLRADQWSRLSEDCPVAGIAGCMLGLWTGSQVAHACSSVSSVVSAGGESRGTASSEGCFRIAVPVNVPGGSMVR